MKRSGEISNIYVQTMTATYENGLNKYKNDSRSVFIDLLKMSDTLGRPIHSFEDYESVCKEVEEYEQKYGLTAHDKRRLDALKEYIVGEYLHHGKKWLENKQKRERELLHLKSLKEESKLKELFPLSGDRRINTDYIDTLLKENTSLNKVSIRQLQEIRRLVEKNPKNSIHKDRVTVKNNLVYIDGYPLPTKALWISEADQKVSQKIADSGLVFPEYIKVLFTFVADVLDKEFVVPVGWESLQDGTVDSERFALDCRRAIDLSVTEEFGKVIGVRDSEVPIGIDKNGGTIILQQMGNNDYYVRVIDTKDVSYYRNTLELLIPEAQV